MPKVKGRSLAKLLKHETTDAKYFESPVSLQKQPNARKAA
jgi:hypothetical protein